MACCAFEGNVPALWPEVNHKSVRKHHGYRSLILCYNRAGCAEPSPWDWYIELIGITINVKLDNQLHNSW